MSSDLQKKLYEFEAEPPQEVWNKIAGALEAEENYPQRLFNYEEQPPANIWQKIEASLEEATPAKVIPFTTRFKKPLRYAAVAVFLAAILVSITLMVRRTQAGSPIEGNNKTTVPTKESATVVTAINPPVQQKTQTTTGTNFVAQVSNDENKDEAKEQKQSSVKRIARVAEPDDINTSVAINHDFIPQAAPEKQLFDFASLDGYMVYTDGDGNAMKASKKLYNMICCPDGDGSCKQRIQQLRQTLTQNTITPDFVGVLDIVRQLQ